MTKRNSAGAAAWAATKWMIKGTLHATSSTIDVGRKLAVEHEQTIARLGRVTIETMGTAVRETGKLVAYGSGTVGKHLHEAASRTDNSVASALGHASGYLAQGASLAGRGVAVAGGLVSATGSTIGDALGGGVRGGLQAASGLVDSAAISEHDLDAMRGKLAELGEVERRNADRQTHAIQAAHQGHRKAELLDLLVVGGVSLGSALRHPSLVPKNVLDAYRLAYPDLQLHETFTQAVERMSADNVLGFVNGLKGKLFEIELVQHLNDGQLPAGWHAEMADSATQPGWDIRVLDDEGHVSEFLQAKATESVAYVNEALRRYPLIDVTSTSEVYSHLTLLGMAEGVRDSGISEAVLQAKVEAALHSATYEAHDDALIPSGVGLAVIALAVFMDKGLSHQDRGREFGSRVGRAGVASGAASLAMIATQTWWIGLLAGVGSRWLGPKGQGKRERYDALKAVLASGEARTKRARANKFMEARLASIKSRRAAQLSER